MSGFLQRFVAVLLAFCLVWGFSGGSTAVAAVMVPDVTDEVYSLATKSEKYMERRADGTYTMTATAKDLGVSQLALDRWMAALGAVNEAILAGYIAVDGSGQAQLTDSGKALYRGQGQSTGEIQARGDCRVRSVRMTAQETSQLEGKLNMYAAGATGILTLIAFMAVILTGAGLVLAAVSLVVAIVGVGAAFWAAWMQSVDRGTGVTINYRECDHGSTGWIVSYAWPTAN